jgi:hypothetical protein
MDQKRDYSPVGNEVSLVKMLLSVKVDDLNVERPGLLYNVGVLSTSSNPPRCACGITAQFLPHFARHNPPHWGLLNSASLLMHTFKNAE